MAQSRLLKRQIRELLRLHFDEGLSQRVIARALGVVRSTVERVLHRFAASGLTWPPDPALSDAELERRLYRAAAVTGAVKHCVRPNYAEVAKELARKGVTRRLLWQEYRDQHADGIGYSVFCDKLMPCSRHSSYTGVPASAYLSTAMIWLSVKWDLFMEPPRESV